MTGSRAGALWLAGRDPLPTRLDRPVVWLMPHAGADRVPLPPHRREDREDAASAKREGGAPRLLRRRMLRALLASLFGLHPDAVSFARAKSGAPAAPDLAVFLSAAGCEGWSAVAVAGAPVGVDIERAARGDSEAIRRWTMVEAYLKALGRGLHVAPEDVRVDAAPGGATLSLATTTAMCGRGRGWLHAPAPDVFAAAVQLE